MPYQKHLLTFEQLMFQLLSKFDFFGYVTDSKTIIYMDELSSSCTFYPGVTTHLKQTVFPVGEEMSGSDSPLLCATCVKLQGRTISLHTVQNWWQNFSWIFQEFDGPWLTKTPCWHVKHFSQTKMKYDKPNFWQDHDMAKNSFSFYL